MMSLLKRTVLAVTVAVFTGLGATVAGIAQTAPEPPRKPQNKPDQKNLLLKEVPDAAKDRKQLLKDLYTRLGQSEDGENSKMVATAIERLWLHSGSDTVDLLMKRVGDLMVKEEFDVALQILDSVVEMAPDFPEGWNRRAAVYFQKKDYGKSLENLRYALAIDPSHYKAIQGLGLLMQEMGEKEAALRAYREALKVHPHMDDVRQSEKELAREVEGQGI
ncbi:MAG: tetratricopeptide repeat protein [Hyphomicrobiaceae bacterium]|nr:tetratricopeptide repeat protein [Hyphomicrobiaceae bacterium]